MALLIAGVSLPRTKRGGRALSPLGRPRRGQALRRRSTSPARSRSAFRLTIASDGEQSRDAGGPRDRSERKGVARLPTTPLLLVVGSGHDAATRIDRRRPTMPSSAVETCSGIATGMPCAPATHLVCAVSRARPWTPELPGGSSGLTPASTPMLLARSDSHPCSALGAVTPFG